MAGRRRGGAGGRREGPWAALGPAAVPAWWMCSAGGSWSARMAAAWTPKRPCRTKSWACTSPPAGARRAATSRPSSVTSTRSYWRRASRPPPSRSSSSPPTTAPRRCWATCAPCTGTGWRCPSTTPTSSEYRRPPPRPCPEGRDGAEGHSGSPNTAAALSLRLCPARPRLPSRWSARAPAAASPGRAPAPSRGCRWLSHRLLAGFIPSHT